MGQPYTGAPVARKLTHRGRAPRPRTPRRSSCQPERTSETMAVDPTGETVRQFRDDDDGGPVVMLNLLRYAGDAGRASYAEYGARVRPFLDAVGATIVYAGECSTALVAAEEDVGRRPRRALPDRAAFLAMVGDPDYQEITHLRTAGARGRGPAGDGALGLTTSPGSRAQTVSGKVGLTVRQVFSGGPPCPLTQAPRSSSAWPSSRRVGRRPAERAVQAPALRVPGALVRPDGRVPRGGRLLVGHDGRRRLRGQPRLGDLLLRARRHHRGDRLDHAARADPVDVHRDGPAEARPDQGALPARLHAEADRRARGRDPRDHARRARPARRAARRATSSTTSRSRSSRA